MITTIIVYLVVMFIGYRVFRMKNPYIRAHRKKWDNQRYYDKYIKWLDRNGGDLPIKEVKGKEEEELIKEINKNIK